MMIMFMSFYLYKALFSDYENFTLDILELLQNYRVLLNVVIKK